MPEPIYRADESLHLKRHRKYKRRMRIIVVLVLMILLICALFLYNALRQKNGTRPQVGPAYTRYIAGPTLYKSQYFEFSDNTKWTFAPNDSTSNEFTYLNYQGGVLAYSVSVYVNQSPSLEELPSTYVLPVQVKNQNSFSVGTLSSQCSTAYLPGDKKLRKVVSIDGTSMLCYPDSPQYQVIAGQEGGDYNLMLRRSNGQSSRYIIIYKDLTTSPQDLPFENFLQTFKAI